MEQPTVSVIISTYNRATVLPRAINSLLAQTYQDFEIIVVDDCSTDNTGEVLAEFGDPRIRVFRHDRNRGVSTGRNTGLQHARGELIAFLDDDDEYFPDSLAVRVDRMEDPEVGLVYTAYDSFDCSTGTLIGTFEASVEGEIGTHLLKFNYLLDTINMMVRKDLAVEVGGFDEGLRQGESMLFGAQVAHLTKVAAVPDVTARSYLSRQRSHLSKANDVNSCRRAYLRVFRCEYRRHPKIRAMVLRRLAFDAFRERNFREATTSLMTAIRIDPWHSLVDGLAFVRVKAHDDYRSSHGRD